MWAKLRCIDFICEFLSFRLDATFYRYSSATLTLRDKMSRNCRPRVRVILFELLMSFSMALEEVRSRGVDETFPDSSRGRQEGTRIYQTIF